MHDHSGRAQLLRLQEQLNHLLVSYLSASDAGQRGQGNVSKSTEDTSPISLDGRFDYKPATSGSEVTLNRKSQIVLLSLFGILVAHSQAEQYLAHLPAAINFGTYTSILGSIWQATPPVLVMTGLATIWAGNSIPVDRVGRSLTPGDGSTSPMRNDLEELYTAVRDLIDSLSLFDGQVHQALHVLQVLEDVVASSSHSATIGRHDNEIPALNVRKALLGALVNAEIAAKVAVDGIKQKARMEQADLLDEEEFERLIGMYALPPVSASRVRSPLDPENRRESMSPSDFASANQSRRTSLVWQRHSPSRACSPESDSFLRNSMRPGANYPISPPFGTAGPQSTSTPLHSRLTGKPRRSRPSSWATGPPAVDTPTRSALAYAPNSAADVSIMSVLEQSSPTSLTSGLPVDPQMGPGSSTPKRTVLTRRRSEQLPAQTLLSKQRHSLMWQTRTSPSSQTQDRLDLPEAAFMRPTRSAEEATPSRPSSLRLERDVRFAHRINRAESTTPQVGSVAEERAKALNRIQNLRTAIRPGSGRDRPSSMYELASARLIETTNTENKRSSLSPVDLPNSSSQEDARRWSSQSHFCILTPLARPGIVQLKGNRVLQA